MGSRFPSLREATQALEIAVEGATFYFFESPRQPGVQALIFMSQGRSILVLILVPNSRYRCCTVEATFVSALAIAANFSLSRFYSTGFIKGCLLPPDEQYISMSMHKSLNKELGIELTLGFISFRSHVFLLFSFAF